MDTSQEGYFPPRVIETTGGLHPRHLAKEGSILQTVETNRWDKGGGSHQTVGRTQAVVIHRRQERDSAFPFSHGTPFVELWDLQEILSRWGTEYLSSPAGLYRKETGTHDCHTGHLRGRRKSPHEPP